MVGLAREHCSRVRRVDPDGRWRELLRCSGDLFGPVADILARNYSFRRRFASAVDAQRGVEVYAARFLEKGIPVWLPIACDGTDGIHVCYQRNGAGAAVRFWHRAPLRRWKPPYWLLAGIKSLPPKEAGPRGYALKNEPEVLEFFAAQFRRTLQARLRSAEEDLKLHAAATAHRRKPVATVAQPPRLPVQQLRRHRGPLQVWVEENREGLEPVVSDDRLRLDEKCLELDRRGVPLPPGWAAPLAGPGWAGLYANNQRNNLSVTFSRLRMRFAATAAR